MFVWGRGLGVVVWWGVRVGRCIGGLGLGLLVCRRWVRRIGDGRLGCIFLGMEGGGLLWVSQRSEIESEMCERENGTRKTLLP